MSFPPFHKERQKLSVKAPILISKIQYNYKIIKWVFPNIFDNKTELINGIKWKKLVSSLIKKIQGPALEFRLY